MQRVVFLSSVAMSINFTLILNIATIFLVAVDFKTLIPDDSG
jgi:hypothetical protein